MRNSLKLGWTYIYFTPIYWAATVGADAGHDCGAISSADFDHCSESPGYVHVDQGGADHTGGEGGSREEGGGNEEGGGVEEREESSVDGLVGWARLGKERQLPQIAVDCAQEED